MKSKGTEAGLLAVRIFLGVFFLFEGWDKHGWLLHPETLNAILHRWADAAPPASRWYDTAILIPGVQLFSRLTFLGEVATGLALICGAWTRLAALAAFLLVLNIHFAHGTLFTYPFLSAGDGLPVLGGLLGLTLGGGRLPWSLKKGK